ncbi:hypothetical protein [Pseudomonas fontis]|uniref:Proteasome subunit beta n=1 Tax=Pseudomonas fontis TaxID=2942633 RepID=A0ABT5NTE2_9PSED|nr:hypothetical protein [Pseudomonas fontis]MDD0976912.1 hypothetical protein [Pseudomonas fontis]MDD0991439.1 hypothetical protein [Pseudomonas fontis]
MTTIVWDGTILAADRLHSSRIAAKTYDAKIFPPKIKVLFEGSPLIAFGGAGKSLYIKTFEALLSDSAVVSLEEVKLQLAEDARMAINETLYTSLLILTEDACYKVWLEGKKPLHENVSGGCAAIGSGSIFAKPLISEAGVFAALARAARCDARTGYRVDLVSRAPGSKIRPASYREQISGCMTDLRLVTRDKVISAMKRFS